jgi:hypothetical protein
MRHKKSLKSAISVTKRTLYVKPASSLKNSHRITRRKFLERSATAAAGAAVLGYATKPVYGSGSGSGGAPTITVRVLAFERFRSFLLDWVPINYGDSVSAGASLRIRYQVWITGSSGSATAWVKTQVGTNGNSPESGEADCYTMRVGDPQIETAAYPPGPHTTGWGWIKFMRAPTEAGTYVTVAERSVRWT